MRWIDRQLRNLIALVALTAAAGALAQSFPSSIALPNGWLPEGIVTARGPVIYSGSRGTGGIYMADLRTGQGQILVAGPGTPAVGLSFDARTNYLFVAGGGAGNAYVYDATTGATVASFQLSTTTPTFINDVIVTRDAAYFTNSNQPVIYRLPLGVGGSVSPQTAVQTIPLSGDYQQVPGTNANGIEATANGQSLIIVNSALGVLYSVNPNTGVASLIDLGGASVLNGDGLLLEGTLLYVVRNRLNVVEVFRLNPDLASGTLLDSITSPAFDVPTTIARFGNALYLVNARFTTPPTPTTPYNIVRIAGLCDDPAEDCAPPMTLRIVPGALNLRSNAGLVAAVLGAAPGYSLGDWMLRDVRFGNTAALSFARASDGETYVATFPKSAFGSLPAGPSVGVTMSGTLANDAEQETFSTGATVNVIR